MSNLAEEYNKIWKAAEEQLRKHGYSITLEQFENIFGSFSDMVADYENFQDKVMLVVHEAVEAEEVKKITGKWILPRDYYDEIGVKTGKVVVEPHLIAEKIAPIEHRTFELAKKPSRVYFEGAEIADLLQKTGILSIPLKKKAKLEQKTENK